MTPIDNALLAAVQHHQANRLGEAERAYRNILADHPDHPDSLHLLGVLAAQTGHVEQGIDLIRRSVRIRPDFPDAYQNLGRLLADKGMLAESTAAYQKLVELRPFDATALNSLGISLARQELLDEAAVAFRRAIEIKPSYPEPYSDLAAILLQKGRLDESIANSSKAIQLRPNFPEAHHNLGKALIELKQFQPAASAFRTVIRIRPDWAEAQLNLCIALGYLGKFDEGIAVARRLLQSNPASAEGHRLLGHFLRQTGQSPEAIAAYTEAIRLKPDWAEPRFDLGSTLRGVERYVEALASLDQAIRINPGYFEAHIERATIFSHAYRIDQALEAHKQAAALRPDDVATHEVLGFIYLNGNQAPAAIESFRKAIDVDPRRATAWNGLGMANRSLGRFNEAADAFHKVIEIEPKWMTAYTNLANVGWEPADSKEVDRLLAELDAPEESLDRRYAAGFAIGKILDKADRFDEAFAAYSKANALFRQKRASLGEVYHPEYTRALVASSIRRFTADFFAKRPWGDPSELPVFIVGMPRSGTTLVEQIAASHSQVFGAGEQTDVFEIVSSLGSSPEGDLFNELSPKKLQQIATAHLARLAARGGSAIRVIDKLPSNILWLGLIALLFPGARIILCSRDARDTSLSCFFQWFTTGHLFSYDLAECGREYRQIEKIAKHWKSVLPLKILEVQYESMVANTEAESRRLISFLGLDWEPGCLDYHKTDRTVLTSSLWQVRQPIYSRSVGRWRAYEKHLGPLFKTLEE